ncbi:hypothetical protein PLICRDRAFT_170055 [Plicaturopsis crispa FD-325 SS-3]|nr:hypothetical protein PLICRDRAFT_170055 [Plicaturopsis crispa FD-325 SS-3]
MSESTPSLQAWAQTHLSALYESSDPNAAFEAAFSPSAQIYLNHEALGRPDLKERVVGRVGAAANGASVKWENIIAVPKEKGDENAGIVAGFLVVTRSLRFRIRAAPAQTQTFITISAKIEQDPSVAPDASGDRRRIVHLFETALDQVPQIHLQTPREST